MFVLFSRVAGRHHNAQAGPVAPPVAADPLFAFSRPPVEL